VHVVRDGWLITGQNPSSSRATAQALLDALVEKGVALPRPSDRTAT
jgi:putative intracellular protease/amidase